ncbi:hypothetical protein J5N97_028662 [Dioscorea zingiberensis]|uniref:Uncharacterized protein n=1 Tax=Dioscorea zingiberensis TaxID=325984 RepID=A0A9D5H518_9LILI|nr:hypothetical protein J5N97_028662 [Dioscorea zingiberensis]
MVAAMGDGQETEVGMGQTLMGSSAWELEERRRWRRRRSRSISVAMVFDEVPRRTRGEEHEWDSDGFVIPSLSIEDSDVISNNVPELIDPKLPPKEEEKIYLGPHGAPRSQSKQQELTATSHRQKLKHKVKEADWKFGGTGRENKVESLRELVGSRTTPRKSTPLLPTYLVPSSKSQGFTLRFLQSDPRCCEDLMKLCS